MRKNDEIIDIDLAPTLFNPLHHHLAKFIQDTSIRKILVYGGSSAGKTHEIIQTLLIDSYNENYNIACFRKEQSSIRDTIHGDFDEISGKITNHPVLKSMFTVQEFKIKTDQGNFAVLRGLDKPDKVKGLKGYKKLYFDEFDQFTPKDWSEAQRRLRGMIGQQLIASWNPVSENHWIKTEIIDKDEWIDLPTKLKGNPYSKLSKDSFIRINKKGNTILIKTNYKDNKWVVGNEIKFKSGKIVKYGQIDQHALDHFEEMKKKNILDYMIYGLGEWGVISNDLPFFYYVRRESLIEDLNIWSTETMVFSFDFNIDSCACTVGQYSRTQGIRVLGCHVVYGGIRRLCQELKKKEFGYFPHSGRVIVTGDPSGKNGNATSGVNNAGEKITSFMIIKEELNLRPDQFKHIPKSACNHEVSRDLCNEVFWGIPIFFDKDYCKELWEEIFKAKPKEDKKGFGKIELYKNRDAGFEMDRVDSFRYFIACIMKNPKNLRKLQSSIELHNKKFFNLYQSYEKALMPKLPNKKAA